MMTDEEREASKRRLQDAVDELIEFDPMLAFGVIFASLTPAQREQWIAEHETKH